MADLEFSLTQEWEKAIKKGGLVNSYIPETAIDENGQKYERNHLNENSKIYKIIEEDGEIKEYRCNDCDSEIRATTVAHSIHDGPFPLSGSGRVTNEQVPYCPTCDEKPNFHGSPIKVKSEFS